MVEGPEFSVSPFVTIHMRVYEASISDLPEDALFIYDSKTTIDEIIQDDWYNFDIKILDTRCGYTQASSFSEKYFLSLSSSGGNENNFVLWELVDNDEYMVLPSFFKV